MRKTLLAIILTATVTWICFNFATGTRHGVERLWLISSVKAPGRMALDEIYSDLTAGRCQAAKDKVQVLRSQWNIFEREDNFRGEAIGNIMVQFAKLPKQAQQ